MKKILLVFSLILVMNFLHAQSSFYTAFQVGGQFGFANKDYKGAFNGYAVHMIFGKNFYDRAFLGFGLGNETFRGTYQAKDSQDEDQRKYNYDTYMLPLFIDGRLPIGLLGRSSSFGALANAGYAPKISAVYDKGFLFRGGFYYLYETDRRTDYTISATYGYQQLSKNNHRIGHGFQHQHFSIAVGLMLK